MINTPDIEEAKRLIQKSERPIVIIAQNDQFNRKILEYGKFDILLSPETGNRKTSVRQLDSGFNHVLGRIAKKNNISIGVDMKSIQKLPKAEKARRLAKIKQNLAIMRKTKTTVKILNSDSKREAFHFLISLGASTAQAKLAIS